MPASPSRLAAAAAVAVFSSAGPAVADAQTIQGARLLALSDSQRALGNGNDALYVNVAGLALSSLYAIEVNYLDDLTGSTRRYNASLMDSQAGPVAGGLAYTFMDIGLGQRDGKDVILKGHRAEIGTATKVYDTIALGVALRYMNFTEKLGDDPVEDGAHAFSGLTMDAGIQWRSEAGFAVGLAAYNFFNNDAPAPPFSWGGGVGYDSGVFSVELDVVHDVRNQSVRLTGGAGLILGEAFVVRAGGLYDFGSETANLSIGLGYGNKNFGIDAGFQHRLTGEGGYLTGPERSLAVGAHVYFM